MSSVTYTQVQELVKQVPAAKLNRIYNMILKITEKSEDTVISSANFLKLPLSERRKIMRHQAQNIVNHYKKTTAERTEWQEGNFKDES